MHFYSIITSQLNSCIWNHGNFSYFCFNARISKSCFYSIIVFRSSINFKYIIFRLKIFCTCFKSKHSQFIFVMTFFIDNENAFRFEHPAYTAAFTKVTTLFRERVAHICSRTVTIIRHNLYSNGNTGRTITFIYDFFVCVHIRSANALIDSTLNIILRNIVFTSFL